MTPRKQGKVLTTLFTYITLLSLQIGVTYILAARRVFSILKLCV